MDHFIDIYKNHGENDFTYELCGPKINGNPEKISRHTLVPHGIDLCQHFAVGVKMTYNCTMVIRQWGKLAQKTDQEN